ncbi:Mce family protein [Gordonia otitidis NBRC 100426]|uniref:Mce family protein n=1 Tax=Gordonia otitidis (strain DSM 44809 / CCUG 52243 / JCM 12355 / NBRC 100426 / IFM 10032) TaxID=1108044 RepID=H5TN88_GORO1|nr:Mce family protein [Gordonia otitidis NBRC 100426]
MASGCGWHGVESVRLPGGQGTGAGAYSITVDMPDVTNITANSPVLVDNVEVGRITSISLVDWHARLHLSLNGEVSLPANAVASIGQTSLLGSQHIELAPPPGTAPIGHLEPNAVIPIERAGAYPTTEQTLSALSVVVNGGGLAQLGDIVDGANDALAGRTDTVKDLVAQLTKTSKTIEARRGQISTALNGLDHLASVFADDAPTLDDAISRISPALTELVSRRQRLSDALTALDRFSDSAEHVITASASNVRSVVSDVAPFLKSLADSGGSITSRSTWHSPCRSRCPASTGSCEATTRISSRSSTSRSRACDPISCAVLRSESPCRARPVRSEATPVTGERRQIPSRGR